MSTIFALISMILLISFITSIFNSSLISIEFPLIIFMSSNMKMSLILDWMSLLFLSTVTFISSMILLFSTKYIPVKEQKQFMFMLLMFILSMMLLILSDNIIFILLGWDGLGLSSYILVIYYQNPSSSASGSITILSNRVGDILILMSISLMFMEMNWNFSMSELFHLLPLILISIAASSKSAQFPFSAWLPAAMAAPTPISALVHSSTLVTAGVFILIRLLFSPHNYVMIFIMIIASMTSIYASMSANWEQDMKKIIALSTLSQIAIMMFAISISTPLLAYFHLITHALFKSLMFLCAGIMIHNSSYQDSRHMNFTMKNSPASNSILGISTFALMGTPFMSGFFSKDSIMEAMLKSSFSFILCFLMISSIGMTACYSLRMMKMSLTLFLKSKPDSTAHPSNSMEFPVMIMSPLSITSGVLISWLMFPEQLFILPFPLMMTIINSLFMGIMLGMLLNFNSKKFIKMGEPAISLWFIHFISTFTTLTLSPKMKNFFKMDSSWQESYGPNQNFLEFKNMSSIPELSNSSLLFITTTMFILPPTLLIMN